MNIRAILDNKCVFPNCWSESGRHTYFCDTHKLFRPLDAYLFQPKGETRSWVVDPMTAVYVMGSPEMGAVKIGIAADVLSRLSTIQTGFPRRLSLYGASYTTRAFAEKVERECHRILTDFGMHLNGEWFDVDPNDACELVGKCASNLGVPLFTSAEYYAFVVLDDRMLVDDEASIGRVRQRIKKDLAREILDAHKNSCKTQL